MNDLEEKLRRMGLDGPSADLDRRMGEIFGTAAQAPKASRSPGQSWRLLALAASGAAAVFLAVFLAAHHRKPETIVYRFEAKGPLRQLLLEPPSTADSQPRFTVNGSAP